MGANNSKPSGEEPLLPRFNNVHEKELPPSSSRTSKEQLPPVSEEVFGTARTERLSQIHQNASSSNDSDLRRGEQLVAIRRELANTREVRKDIRMRRDAALMNCPIEISPLIKASFAAIEASLVASEASLIFTEAALTLYPYETKL